MLINNLFFEPWWWDYEATYSAYEILESGDERLKIAEDERNN